MKKLSRIDESIWTDMQKRSSGEELREEDTFKFNIKDMKEIDLGPEIPVIWADIDLIANGTDYFDWYTVEEMLPQIRKTGWRLPYGPNEMKSIIKTLKRFDKFEATWKAEAYGMLKNAETNTYVSFPTSNKWEENYWCEDDYNPEDFKNWKNARIFETGKNYYEDSSKMILLTTNNLEKGREAKIRLVKDR